MAVSLVTGYHLLNEFKRSKYFRINLGVVTTVEKNGRRILNDKDAFSYFYNSQYKSTIYGQGNVGDIKFYTDHFIRDNTIAVYYNSNFEEFLFQFDINIVREKGIDFFLGHILKNVELEYEERVKNEELRKIEEKPKGNPDAILNNPGNVNYEDLKAYLELKNKARFKNNN
jgi:hypothetical protein